MQKNKKSNRGSSLIYLSLAFRNTCPCCSFVTLCRFVDSTGKQRWKSSENHLNETVRYQR